jgi:hypothetical protein
MEDVSFTNDVGALTPGVFELVASRLENITDLLTRFVNSEDFSSFLGGTVMKSLLSDFGIHDTSGENRDLMLAFVQEKQWVSDMPKVISWGIGLPDPGSHVRSSGYVLLDAALFLSSPSSTEPYIVDFLVFNIALREIIGHGLLISIIKSVRAIYDANLSPKQKEDMAYCVEHDVTPPRKNTGKKNHAESGLDIERLLTNGYVLSFCCVPEHHRSVVYAACIDMRGDDGVKKYRIDEAFIAMVMSDVEHCAQHLARIENYLHKVDKSDHIMSTRYCVLEEPRKHIPGMCRHRIDFAEGDY